MCDLLVNKTQYVYVNVKVTYHCWVTHYALLCLVSSDTYGQMALFCVLDREHLSNHCSWRSVKNKSPESVHLLVCLR